MDDAVLDPNDLRAFREVAQAGTISRAALTLGKSQSALSRQMIALEQALGVRLLARNGRGVRLTRAGETLLEYAHQMDDLIARATDDLQAWRERPSGEVTLAVTPAVGHIITRPLLRALPQKLPDVSLSILESHGEMVVNWVSEGRADLAVSFLPPHQIRGLLDSEALIEDDLCLVSRARGAPCFEPMRTAEAWGRPLALPTRRNGMRRHLERLAADDGRTLRASIEVDSFVTMLDAVEAGDADAILPRLAVEQSGAGGRFDIRPFFEPRIPSWLSLHINRDRGHKRAVASTAALIRDICRKIKPKREAEACQPI